MRVYRPAAVLLTAALLFATLPLPAAAQLAPTPLIAVAVPGDTGDALFTRITAHLDAIASGESAVRHTGSIDSPESALRMGRYYGVRVVLWADESAPTRLYTTYTDHTLPLPSPLTTPALDFTPGDLRAAAAISHSIVGQALALDSDCWGPRYASVLDAAIQAAAPGWAGLADAYTMQGVCYSRQPEHFIDAAERLTLALDIGETWYRWRMLAWVRFNQGDTDHAIDTISHAITLAPENESLYLSRGFFFAHTARYPDAIADYTTALAYHPDLPAAYDNRAAAYMALENYEAAIADYTRLIELAPDSTDALAARAAAYQATGDYDAALHDLDTALAENPYNRDELTFQRGVVYLALADYDSALSDLEAYTATHPDDPAGWENLGQVYENLGYTVEAIAAYETALSLAPGAAHLFTALARLYYYNASTELDPSSDTAVETLTLCIQAAGQALAANPEDANAYLYRGLAYTAQNANEAALADFNAVLRLNPSQETATFNRAIVYTRLADGILDPDERYLLLQAAAEDYGTLIDLDFSTYNYLLLYQGYLFVEMDDYPAALDRFAEFDTLYPDTAPDQTYTIYQARAYYGLARYADALAAYSRATVGGSGFYRCEAILGAGVIQGAHFAEYNAALDLLQTYQAENCTTNPILHTVVTRYIQAWQSAAAE